jgi:hypothetical protein
LDPDGGLLLTSFWLYDHISAQAALVRAKYRIFYSGRNRYPGRRFDTSDSGEPLKYDKFILIAKRGG